MNLKCREAAMRTAAVLALLAWGLVGCGGSTKSTKYWYHSSGDTSNFARDQYQCEREASYIRWDGFGGTYMDLNATLYKSCMEARSWSLR